LQYDPASRRTTDRSTDTKGAPFSARLSGAACLGLEFAFIVNSHNIVSVNWGEFANAVSKASAFPSTAHQKLTKADFNIRRRSHRTPVHASRAKLRSAADRQIGCRDAGPAFRPRGRGDQPRLGSRRSAVVEIIY
jgi:hypothetical protein